MLVVVFDGDCGFFPPPTPPPLTGRSLYSLGSWLWSAVCHSMWPAWWLSSELLAVG